MEHEKIEEHVLAQFNILKRIAKGAYGVVWMAEQKSTGQVVALKKIFDAFENVQDAQRTYREVALLRLVDNVEDIVQLLDVIAAKNDLDLYLVFEYVETDVYAMVKDKQLQGEHVRWVMFQVLRALKYLHSAQIVHRDIKPNNILLDSECNAKLCDFGLARTVAASSPLVACPGMTDFVATQWYRAPELLIGSSMYGCGVDIWAAGCLLAEMLSGKPLFPGAGTTEMLRLVVAVTGRPSDRDVDSMECRQAAPILESLGLYVKDEKPLPGMLQRTPSLSPRGQLSSMDIIRQLHARKKIDEAPAVQSETNVLREKLPDAPPDALDLLGLMLKFDPRERIPASSALRHSYFSPFANLVGHIVAEHPIRPKINDHDKLTPAQYRQALVEKGEADFVAPVARSRRMSQPPEPMQLLSVPSSPGGDGDDEGQSALLAPRWEQRTPLIGRRLINAQPSM